jgi:prolyl 4-hydroxylase
MSAVVRFPSALGAWVEQHLAEGVPPDALVRAMQDREISAESARHIVDAFVRSRTEGTPAPVDTVEGWKVQVLARAERLSLTVLGGVLDADECQELIDRARDRLAPSTLVDPMSGRDVVSVRRGSSGMFFRPREDAFVARLDERMAELMGLPEAHGEGLQVLHYAAGAGSAPHFDFLAPTNEANIASIARSGQRVSTMVTYLNDVCAGGETAFPALGWSVTPRRGHAVCFKYCNSRGELDQDSVHHSTQVLRGEKWVVTKWMRQKPFISA